MFGFSSKEPTDIQPEVALQVLQRVSVLLSHSVSMIISLTDEGAKYCGEHREELFRGSEYTLYRKALENATKKNIPKSFDLSKEGEKEEVEEKEEERKFSKPFTLTEVTLKVWELEQKTVRDEEEVGEVAADTVR